MCNKLSTLHTYAEITEVGGVDVHILSQNSNSTSASYTSSSDCSLTAGTEVPLLQKHEGTTNK